MVIGNRRPQRRRLCGHHRQHAVGTRVRRLRGPAIERDGLVRRTCLLRGGAVDLRRRRVRRRRRRRRRRRDCRGVLRGADRPREPGQRQLPHPDPLPARLDERRGRERGHRQRRRPRHRDQQRGQHRFQRRRDRGAEEQRRRHVRARGLLHVPAPAELRRHQAARPERRRLRRHAAGAGRRLPAVQLRHRRQQRRRHVRRHRRPAGGLLRPGLDRCVRPGRGRRSRRGPDRGAGLPQRAAAAHLRVPQRREHDLRPRRHPGIERRVRPRHGGRGPERRRPSRPGDRTRHGHGRLSEQRQLLVRNAGDQQHQPVQIQAGGLQQRRQARMSG